MASLGSSVRVPCPSCQEPTTVPVAAGGREGNVLTVTIDLGPLHAHVAAAHRTPQEDS